MPIRAFIAARVRLYREGLAELLDREQAIKVVGSAGDRGETLARVRALRPDVVLLDPSLPESMEAVRELAGPVGVKVVALATPEMESAVIACAEAGVSGYVTDVDSVGDLIATIRSVAKDELRCSPRVAGALLRRVTALAAQCSPSFSQAHLTARETEILRLIEEGLSNKAIAIRLGIELPTVKNHVHRILEKLGVARRGEAVARLRRGGLLETRAPQLERPTD